MSLLKFHWRCLHLFVLLVLVNGLNSCGVTTESSPVPTSTVLPTSTNTALPTSTVLPTGTNTALPTSTSTVAPTLAVRITFQRTGGFAGLEDMLVINATDRSALLIRKQQQFTKTLSPETLAHLLTQFEQANFSHLAPEYVPTNPCCDRMEYRISYNNQTVHTMDGAIPVALQPVLTTLTAILAEFSV